MGGGASTELSEDTVADLRRNTSYTSEEIHEMYQSFKSDFPEGVITRDRFAAMYSKMFPRGNPDKFARYLFNAYDIDGNGEVDFHEFMQTICVATKGSLDDKLQWAFDLYDLDGDGEVTREEATEMIMAIHQLKGINSPRDQCERAALQIFSSIDKDHSDSLSREEFVEAVKRSELAGKLLGLNN